jgi:DNA-binding response OmpR family regulator
MRIHIIDTEPRWLEFAAAALTEAGHETTDDNADLLLVSDRMLDRVEPGRSVVLTSQPTAQGAIAAYRAGALRYAVRDFRAGKLLALVKEVERIISRKDR